MVNCVLQDTDAPLMFVTTGELGSFAPGTLIVDVSCDEGMGFSWARPTSFAEPMITVGNNVSYYAVDHSPSYLWNSATWEISEAVLPHLGPVLAGPRGGTRTRRSGGPSKSVTGLSVIHTSCPSSTVHRTIRTPRARGDANQARTVPGLAEGVRRPLARVLVAVARGSLRFAGEPGQHPSTPQPWTRSHGPADCCAAAWPRALPSSRFSCLRGPAGMVTGRCATP